MTIKAQIVLAYTVVFGVMLTAFAFLVYRSSRDAELSKLDAFLATHAQKVQAEVEEQINEHQFPVVPEITGIHTDGLSGVRLRLYAADGAVVVSDSLLPPVSQAALREAVQGATKYSYAVLRKEDCRLLTAPAEVNDRNAYVLQLSASLAPVTDALERLRLLFLFSIPTVLLSAAVGAYVITRAAFRPVAAMAETAERISGNNLGSRLRVPPVKDEIHKLGTTLNNMMERIQLAFNSQRQFVADASHEFRTPLTVICSELEYAQQQTSDPRVLESIRTALAEVDRLSRMTEGMLLLSKLDASHLPVNFDDVRLDEILVECVQLMRGVAQQKHITVSLQIDEAAEMQGDRDKLKSAFLNLLDNAIKYSNSNAGVSVSLAVSAARRASVRFEDNGHGIAESDLPNVFKRFYRAQSSRTESSGSGLGLAVVEQVVKLHGGSVDIKSELEKGTTVTVTFPIKAKTQ